jgi:regulator of replication initiation timing
MDRSNVNNPNRKNLVIPLREVLSMTTGLVVDLYEENHELREENTKLKAKLAQLENKNF